MVSTCPFSSERSEGAGEKAGKLAWSIRDSGGWRRDRAESGVQTGAAMGDGVGPPTGSGAPRQLCLVRITGNRGAPCCCSGEETEAQICSGPGCLGLLFGSPGGLCRPFNDTQEGFFQDGFPCLWQPPGSPPWAGRPVERTQEDTQVGPPT